VLAGAIALAAGCSGGRTEYPVATFADPTDTVLTRYASVPVGAWLGGRTWVVVAQEFNEAAVVEFGAGTVRVLGGPGDAEIRNPFTVFVTGDTAWVGDWALRRVTAWATDGRMVAQFPAPDALRGALPRARDAAGQFYFEVAPLAGRDGSGNRDSGAVVRASPDLAVFDTIARLSPLDLAEVNDVSGRRFERRVFSGTDRWGVVRDGTVWVGRSYQNRVFWIEPGGETLRGPSLPDRVIEVTATDRDHWLLQFPEDLRPAAERLPFAPLKPPFEEALTSPLGEVWLEKSRPATDSVRSYHVVDRRGELRLVVVLPSRQGRVIALGDTLALVAEQYRDGVRLMEVRMPLAAVGGPAGRQ
jgi:hypothetical protein